jgi:serine/threonine-protein kinase SRPK3
VKIADLGNACWRHHHFATEIQTRQYRSPETILGIKYDTSADIWSFACMLYEMLSGELLFQPTKTREFGKNEHHLALVIMLNYSDSIESRSFPKELPYCSKKI